MSVYYDYSFSYSADPVTATQASTITAAPTTAAAATNAAAPPVVTTSAERDDKSPLNLLSRAASAVTDESVSSVSSAAPEPWSPKSNQIYQSPQHPRPTAIVRPTTVLATLSDDSNPTPSPGSLILDVPSQARNLPIPTPPVIVAPPATAAVTIPKANTPPFVFHTRLPTLIPPPPPTVPHLLPATARPPVSLSQAVLPSHPAPQQSNILAVFPQYAPSASAFSVPMPPGMEIMLPATHRYPSGTTSGTPYGHCGIGEIHQKGPTLPVTTSPTLPAASSIGEKISNVTKAKGKRVKYKMQYHYISMKRWEAHRYIESLARGSAHSHHHTGIPLTALPPHGTVLEGHRLPAAVPMRAPATRPISVPSMIPVHPHRPPVASSVMVPY